MKLRSLFSKFTGPTGPIGYPGPMGLTGPMGPPGVAPEELQDIRERLSDLEQQLDGTK